MTMALDLMAQIEQRAKSEKERVFYSRAGEIHHQEIRQEHLLFRTARKNNRGTIPILRLVVCAANPTSKPKAGIQYFIPLSHKKRKGKYFEVLFSCQTIYSIGERYGIAGGPSAI